MNRRKVKETHFKQSKGGKNKTFLAEKILLVTFYGVTKKPKQEQMRVSGNLTHTQLTMVELEASSPAQTSVPPPLGLLKTAFLVSSLQDEPALNVCTGEQEQLGS